MAQGAGRSLQPRFFQLFLWPLSKSGQSFGDARLLAPSVPLPEPPQVAPPLAALPLLAAALDTEYEAPMPAVGKKGYPAITE